MTNARAPRRLSRVLLLATLALGTVHGSAHAEPGTVDAAGVARAEQLFKHARELMAAGRYEQACPELEESQRLDPAPGTLLNLADCYEKSGLLASAWASYRALLPEARRLAQRDRERYATDRIAALERRVSRLSLELEPSVPVEQLRVELDGRPLETATLRAPFPVDGGGHRLSVSRAGHEPWTAEVAVARERDQKTLRVPALRPLPSASAGAPAGAVSFGGSGAPGTEARERPLRTSIYVAAAGTLALAAGAGVTGGLALAKANSFEDANQDPSRTPAERQSLRDDAQSLALVSTVLTGAAVAAAGVTLYLYTTRPSAGREAPPRSASLRVSPWLGRNGAGLGLAGAL